MLEWEFVFLLCLCCNLEIKVKPFCKAETVKKATPNTLSFCYFSLKTSTEYKMTVTEKFS